MTEPAVPAPHASASWLFTAAAILVIVAVNGILIAVYGTRGFMPLDNSIVPDIGYRLYLGQAPFDDFLAPCGLLPGYIQRWLFRLLGVDYRAVLIHMAAAASLFATALYFLFRAAMGGIEALAFSLLSSPFLFSQVGTPYFDNYALILCFFAIAAFVHAISTGRVVLWAATAVLLVLALFAKQNPTVFVIALFAVISALHVVRRPARIIGPAVAAAVGLALLLAIALVWWPRHPILDPWVYLIEMPAQLGRERIGNLGLRGFFFFYFVPKTGFRTIVAMLMICAFGLLLRSLRPRVAPQISIACLSFGTCYIFVLTTLNQFENTFTLIISAFAFLFSGCTTVLRAVPHLYPPLATVTRPASVILRLALLATVVVSYGRVAEYVNRTRSVSDMMFSPANAVWTGDLEPRFNGVYWDTPDSYHGERAFETIHRAVDALRRFDRDFLYIGDITILYWLAGRSPAAPVVWSHAGLTYPTADSPHWDRFQARFATIMAGKSIDLVVLDGGGASMGTSLGTFPVLNRCLARALERWRFGKIEIVRVPPDCWREEEAPVGPR